jgi:hypothetical protein
MGPFARTHLPRAQAPWSVGRVLENFYRQPLTHGSFAVPFLGSINGTVFLNTKYTTVAKEKRPQKRVSSHFVPVVFEAFPAKYGRALFLRYFLAVLGNL